MTTGKRQGSALLSGQRRQRRDRGHCKGSGSPPARSWPPAPARPTQRFRSSGVSGTLGAKKRHLVSWRIATCRSTRPWSTTFRPFGDAMAKLSDQVEDHRTGGRHQHRSGACAGDGKRRIDASYEIYLGLYQAITGPEERQKLFREFSPDFFDLIVIDECHRGSAAEDSAWRKILEYFSAASQIGLTATPRDWLCWVE